MAVKIAKAYQINMGRALPVTAIVFDSCPGRSTVRAIVLSGTVGLSNFFMKILVSWFLRSLYILYVFSFWLRGSQEWIERARNVITDKAVFDVNTRRLYIYSVADDMNSYKDIEEHIVNARELGYAVDVGVFEGSGHVAHMMQEPGRYWDLVQRFWKQA